VALTPSGDVLSTINLTADPVKVGRGASNDIVLLPDPDQLVSRAHCRIELLDEHWYVRDLSSRNHVYVERRGILARVDRAELLHDDQVCLHASKRTDMPEHWRIVFSDPGQTASTDQARWLQYFPSSQTIWMLGGVELPRQLDLKPKSRRMLTFMLARHHELAEPPDGVLISLDELKSALWPRDTQPLLRTDGEVQNIAWELRRTLGELEERTGFLRTVRDEGYRLVPRP
jgi:hypothetical protein